MELQHPFQGDPHSSHKKRLLGKVSNHNWGFKSGRRSHSNLFAQHGSHVIIADILDNLGAKLADSIRALYIHCNVAEEDDMESVAYLALAWKGQLDIMLNNAGVGGLVGSIANADTTRMKALLAVNVNGNIYSIKQAAQAMIKSRRRGSIICTSSSAAIMEGLASHGYTLSKKPIVGLMRSTACELGVHGIRVNCISPHGVPTEMLVSRFRQILRKPDLTPEEMSQMVRKNDSLLRGRGGSVEYVPHAALFSASEEAGFMTGHNLIIDGGFTSACNDLSFIYQEQRSVSHAE